MPIEVHVVRVPLVFVYVTFSGLLAFTGASPCALGAVGLRIPIQGIYFLTGL